MPDLPAAARSRLIAAEKRNRRDTKARGLKAEAVSIDALWEISHGLCGCGCGWKLDVTSKWDAKEPPLGYAVLAHVLARGSLGEHTADNVRLWRWACNRLAGHRETSEAASVKRFSVVKGRPKKGSIASPGFANRSGPSVLSRAHKNYQKRGFQKRAVK